MRSAVIGGEYPRVGADNMDALMPVRNADGKLIVCSARCERREAVYIRLVSGKIQPRRDADHIGLLNAAVEDSPGVFFP